MKKRVLNDMAAIFVIMFLLPYVITVVAFGVPKTAGIRQPKEEKTVCVAYGNREETMPLKQYLISVLAAQIPADYSLEAIKAQAVLARTYYAMHEMDQEVICVSEVGQAFLPVGQMEQLWGDSYETYYKKLEQAVTDTQNECLFYKEQLAEPYFHAVSNGMTRDGMEIFEDEAYAYLKSSLCEQDAYSSGYVTIKTYTQEELGELFARSEEAAAVSAGGVQAEVSLEHPAADFQILERDRAGYVTKIVANGETMHGEIFRARFSLPSACFQIEDWGQGIRFVCKGLGHGMGMSLYTANVLADEGEDYIQILQYFFADVAIKEGF